MKALSSSQDPTAKIWSALTLERKRQFYWLAVLMVLGAVAEFMTLGALVPFISVMTDPNTALAGSRYAFVLAPADFLGFESIRLYLTVLFCTIVLIAAIVRIGLLWATARYSMLIGQDFSMRLFSNIVLRPYTYHLGVTSSDMLAAGQKVQAIVVNVILPLLRAISAVITAGFVLGALLFVSPTVTVSLIVLVGGFYLVIWLILQPMLRNNSIHIARDQTQRIRMVQEGIGGIRDIIVNGLGRQYYGRFEKVEFNLRIRLAYNVFFQQAPRYLIEMVVIVALSVAAFMMTSQAQEITGMLPLLGTFALGTLRLFPIIQTIYRAQAQIAGSSGSVDDVLEFSKLAGLQSLDHKTDPIPFNETTSFEKAGYSYPDNETPALHGIDITIEKGTFIAVTGKTGSGKSTLVDLLMGLLSPTEGEIRVDGKPLTEADLPGWQRNIAHVPQSVFLVEASVAENISLGSESGNVDPDRLQKAIRMAELTDVIDQLPDGAQTQVGERGSNFSGGQRQRIGIARALYLNRPLLVLDEATSALDTGTEQAVLRNIREDASLTVVSITHRPETLSIADRVIKVEGGRVA